MLQNNEKTAEVLKAEKIVEQAKARLAEAKRKASQQKRKEENQHKYMMGEDVGFLSFINQYFSSFSTCHQDVGYSMNNGDFDEVDIEVYLRIVLANIEQLHRLISDLENCLSRSQINREVICAGEIQGRLNVRKYVQSMAIPSAPQNYPCIVKTKTYVTPENVYLIFVIKNVIRQLDGFKKFLANKGSKTIYSELELLEKHLRAFRMFSTKAYFKDCQSAAEQLIKQYGQVFPEAQANLIYTRSRKGKISSAAIYARVFDWYRTYINGTILVPSIQKLQILRYSNEFANRLFELWCLYSIKKTFLLRFRATLIDERNVMEAGEGYVFKLMVPTGGILELYYQKGSGLYWKNEDDLMWKYTNGAVKTLKGIPDISIKYITNEESLVMIDIKNRVRGVGTNSEEIYKMIGYFSNFRKAFEEYYCAGKKKQAALVFRNDNYACDEMLENDMGYRLMTISVGISEDADMNENQFEKLCKYVLWNAVEM